MAVTTNIRAHRDDPSRRGALDRAHAAESISPEAVLARGHALLRFPADLESAFLADTLESRRKLVMLCGLLGVVGVLLGAANIRQLTPEIGDFTWRLVWLWIAGTAACLVFLWFEPLHWRRNWHGEAMTTFMATAIGLLITWMATASYVDTAFTHSAKAAIPVMYSCIAARVRFRWALAGALISFLGYAGFVHGHTPEQSLVAASNVTLMALSYAFVLAANYTFEHSERRNWLLRKVEQDRRSALLSTSRHLHTLSVQDPLTGLSNRRQFDTDMRNAMSHAATDRHPLALLLIDVDYFKPYNDHNGHPAGDACLIRIAQTLQQVAQTHGGFAARLGGEEFSLILPHHTLGQAQEAGESLCQAVAAAQISHGASSVSPVVTVSVGAAQDWPSSSSSAMPLITQADQALYQAKQGGRNRVSSDASQPMAPNTMMAYATEPAARAPDTAPSEDEIHAEASLTQTLESAFLWLSFPPEQERVYRRQRANQRRKLLALVSLLGLVIYNGYIFANRAMFPDISNDMLVTQLWLSALMMLMTIFAFVMRMPMIWREGFYSLGTSVVAIFSTWVLSHSTQTSALSFAVCLALIPMFSGVAARQPFWFTCIPALITSVAAAWMLMPNDTTQDLVYIDSLFIIINLTAYTLIMAYTQEHGQRKEWLLAQIDQLQRKALESATQRLQQLSAVDPLTGICNRRQFEHDLDRIWQEAAQDQRPLAMLIIDIDHFKQYNDGYGHPQGDRCLTQVAEILTRTAHAGKGLAARLGGEEFGILLPGARVELAMALGERVCEAIRAAAIEHAFSDTGIVTISVGVASIRPDAGVDRVSLFATADKALYEAKRMGRNRVVAPGTLGFRA